MKVLIISHNPITTQNNMGKTFLSLFSEFDREELCQLYIYPTLPNVDRCTSFYRVTDKEMLRALIPGKKVGGVIKTEQIQASQGLYEDPTDESLYRNRKNKSALRRLLRDAIWKFGRWYTRDLKSWLRNEAPECVFVAPGAAKFIYDIALRIAQDWKIPIVTYICDEFYFVKDSGKLLESIRMYLFRRKMTELMKKTACLITISEELKEVYTKHFGVQAIVLMTGAAISKVKKPRNEKPQRICYFGNVRCNRYIGLNQIGQELDAINEEKGTNYRLRIYTMEKDSQIRATLQQSKSVELHPFLTGEAFLNAFQQAQLLLHVEAFDEESIDRVRHSVSTKIADSLASGIPLVAYGPDCVSSMQHLLRHDCAMIATSKQQLRQVLTEAFLDDAIRERVAKKGLETADLWHDSVHTSLGLRDAITRAISEK